MRILKDPSRFLMKRTGTFSVKLRIKKSSKILQIDLKIWYIYTFNVDINDHIRKENTHY